MKRCVFLVSVATCVVLVRSQNPCNQTINPVQKCPMPASFFESWKSILADRLTSIYNTYHGPAVSVARNFLRTVPTLIITQAMKNNAATTYVGMDVENANDWDIVRNTIEQRSENLFEKNSAPFTVLFNPFILNSKKIRRKCRKDLLCRMGLIVEDNRDAAVKMINDLTPELVKEFKLLLDDLDILRENVCEVGQCQIIEKVLSKRDDIAQILDNENNINIAQRCAIELIVPSYVEYVYENCDTEPTSK
ncbi:unnamed protein product [Callosobruchus maculatus]|uniref:Uncharacterized protein n=1 Tax=Callosobruchus maculatus TaxID=64391 RepID=A0A653D509_CALMS|nr:unnamed protein product [Callosobruchus maculatus]